MSIARRAERTRTEIRARRAFGATPRTRALPKQALPTQIEREYARAIAPIGKLLDTALQPLLAALPALTRSVRATMLDGARRDVGEARRAAELIAQIRERLVNHASLSDDQLEILASRFADRVKRHQASQMARQVKSALGIEALEIFADNPRLSAITEAFVVENVALIKAILPSTMTGIEGVVTRGITSGQLHSDIAKEIREKYRGMPEKRAKLIARDQVGKFYGAVNSTRHREIGVTEFVWRTVGDERVRPRHISINGEKYKYAEGGHPTEGLPGQPVLCRCYADPVFDGLLEGL